MSAIIKEKKSIFALLLETLFLLGVRTYLAIFDLVTLPFYIALQRPWRYWIKKKYAKPENPDDPYSPYVRTEVRDSSLDFGNGRTIVELLECAISKHGKKDLFGTREVLAEEEEVQKNGEVFTKLTLGNYKWMNYIEADGRIEVLKKSLLAAGCQPRKPIIIFAETRVEWMLTAQACFRVNIPVVTLYATLGVEAIVYGINLTEVSHIVTSSKLLRKLRDHIDRLPLVTHIICMEGHKKLDPSGFPDRVQVLPFSTFEALGQSYNKAVLASPPEPKDTAIIMFTSGSTGIPKGVIISHKNLAQAVRCCSCLASFLQSDETYIAYLPLSHVLEMIVETMSTCLGVPIGYASPNTLITNKSSALKKGCKGDFAALKPTGMTAVPIILDRIRKAIMDEAKQRYGELGLSVFKYLIRYRSFWYLWGFDTPILDALVFRKIRSMIGGRVRTLLVGGAPLSHDTDAFIRATLGVQVLQGYGLTETSACASLAEFHNREIGTCGPPLPNCKIKLLDWIEGGYSVRDRPNPRGELAVWAEFVSEGYYKREDLDSTSFIVDPDGTRWFVTGDIGEILPDGQVKIIDRKKDLIKLQMGEYVSLGKVEAKLNQCPLVENSCVYGDLLSSFVVALVQPNRPKLLELASRGLGLTDLPWDKLCQHPDIQVQVQDILRKHCKESGLEKAEIPLKFHLVPEEWTPDSGLVTGAFKIRRSEIVKYYKSDLDRMFAKDKDV